MQKHDQIKQRLINSARIIFVKFGFDKTTMNEIAIEARKGKSSLYYYFSSKEEIFQAVVEYEAEILKNKLFASLTSIDDAAEQLRIYVVARFKGIKDLGNLYNALRNDLLNHLDFIKNVRQRYDDMELQKLCKILETGNHQNIFNINDVPTAAETILMTIKAVELPLLLDYEADVFEDRLNSLLDIFFNGLKKR
ncbi:MAG: TetR/AcrR family transcriptional regulator [Bacteroidales bacterium]|nr:TetR/AcrR family transcriptional regulator [Bacteroidales bacterium]